MKELVFDELSLEQKIGLVLCAHPVFGQADDEYTLKLIKERRLGAVWANPTRADFIKRIKETADYPIIIVCDAENGHGNEGTIPQLISITAAGGKDEYAYSFGRMTAAQLKKIGINTICNPVVDICKDNGPCGRVMRTFGNDKEVCARLAAKVAEGMHDAGVLAVAKHYPGNDNLPYDSHMREGCIQVSREELIEENLYPYTELIKKCLLDGVMVGHQKVAEIDPDRTATLSRPMTTLLRDLGFDGFYITDALCMLGIVSKYGWEKPVGMAVGAGIDLTLPWSIDTKGAYENLMNCYKQGIFTEDDLNNSVKNILNAQHKVYEMMDALPTYSNEDVENIKKINLECISTVCEEGITPNISKDGKHLFVIMSEEKCEFDFDSAELPTVRDWYYPQRIARKIIELFPNSECRSITQYPDAHQTRVVLESQTNYDDVVFITFTKSEAYTGRECLSTRIVDLMDALQSTAKIVAHIHYGNPFAGATAPYTPRYINGYCSAECVNNTLLVLSGDLTPKGVIPYNNVKFHKKGDVIR